ncbi:hypothetical protein [Mariniflexile sp. AS56]|uniref:hypothetical protein n=1 Tax=Mariniflexile sp. AS56 TaxID=3063957 RepID=UPI0026EC9A58|nr:hypothetical protein [Mariniflexile sp. AS56]MDO7172953.1 hypothetical protein [Mariniflexile sp. AS56]
MENWYLPITIVPGLGLLILSTSNLMVTLSNEISAMIDNSKEKTIIVRKLKQLKLLNMSMVFFYVSVALLLVSAVLNGLYTIEKTGLYISILAIIFALIGLFSLVIFSFRAVNIRQNQFKNNVA